MCVCVCMFVYVCVSFSNNKHYLKTAQKPKDSDINLLFVSFSQ